jgi:endonuclease IV
LGKIGEKGLRFFLKNNKLSDIPIIMETPVDETRKDKDNILYVQNLLNDDA